MPKTRAAKSNLNQTDIERDWMPVLLWTKFFYKQQKMFTQSTAFQNWFIGGNGCFAKDTSMLLYNGQSVKVQDIKLGDILMGDDSTDRNVLSLKRGTEPLYEFEINTQRGKPGTKYTFNESHILYLESVDYKSPVEITVKDYLAWSDRKKRGHYFIKRGVRWPEITNVEIPPYILGAWLGDGDSNGRRFSNIDEEVIKEFKHYIESLGCRFIKSDKWHYQIAGAPNNGSIKNAWQKKLESLSVRYNKHIPKNYLYSSRKNRLELLAGLIDTDGSYRNRRYVFYQTNKSLAEQVCFLSRSIGFHSNLCERNRPNAKKPQYYVTICRNIEEIPCRIRKKQYKKVSNKNLDLHFGVKNIKPLGIGNYYGFTLDGNHRFLGSDFTVLRNTGKTHIVYWSVIAFALGIHPKMPKRPMGEDPKTGEIIWDIAKPPLRICCLVPDFDKVTDVALEKLQSPQIIYPSGTEVGPMLPPSMITREFSRDHKTIDLKNGSSLVFMTDEQGWKAHRGKQFDILCIDEEPSKRVFQEDVRGLRNAKGGGRIIAGMTPPIEEGSGPTWTKDDVLEAALTDEDIYVVNACMMDNPAITDTFIKQFSKGKTQREIDTQVYGKYPNWGDLVHKDFQDTMWNPDNLTGHILENDTPMPDNHDVTWVMAFDWHPSKPCAAIFGWIDRSGNITIFDELDKEVARGKEIDELAKIFKSIEGEPFSQRNFRRWQDPSAKHDYNAVQRGFNAWDAFRHQGIITSAGKNKDPNITISFVNDYFKGNTKDHPRIFIYERCKFLRRFLGNHYWKRVEGGVGKPDAKWSDYPICLRYIVDGVGYKKKTKKKLPYYSFQKPKENANIIHLEERGSLKSTNFRRFWK